jgi:hypothetical protein
VAVLKEGKWVPINGCDLDDLEYAMRHGKEVELSEHGDKRLMYFLYTMLIGWGVAVVARVIYIIWK